MFRRHNVRMVLLLCTFPLPGAMVVPRGWGTNGLRARAGGFRRTWMAFIKKPGAGTWWTYMEVLFVLLRLAR